MKPSPPVVSGCECCISRRRLLAAGCGVCAASAAQGLFARLALAADEAPCFGRGGKRDPTARASGFRLLHAQTGAPDLAAHRI